MGKRIITQRRGRGTSTYRSNSHRYKAEVKHRHLTDQEKNKQIKGIVKDLINCPGHSAPLAEIKYEDNRTGYIFAPEKMRVNQEVFTGAQAPTEPGNTLPLKSIQEGTEINNIENTPGDGGRFCRSAGSSAKVISVLPNRIIIQLPSKKQKKLNPNCRATIGIIAGTGRKEKPIVKAGKAYHMHKAKGRLYPRTSGVAMNAVDHPYGSGRGRHHSKIKTVSRNAPPGRKVGAVAARRTGKRK